jgi:hypothetical protein
MVKHNLVFAPFSVFSIYPKLSNHCKLFARNFWLHFRSFVFSISSKSQHFSMFLKFNSSSNICKTFSVNKQWAVCCENDNFKHVRYSFSEHLLICLNNLHVFFIVSNLIPIIASSTCHIEKENFLICMYHRGCSY